VSLRRSAWHRTISHGPTAGRVRLAQNERPAFVCSLPDIPNDVMPQLCCIDMDGTILGSQNQIHPRNVEAVIRLLESTDIRFVPATGKSRSGAVRSMASLGEYLQDAHPGGVPGVYLQGLCVYGADGDLIHERTLLPDVARRVVALSKLLEISLIAYGINGDTILCEVEDEETAKLESYHEPAPVAVGNWDSVIGSVSIHKFIFMAPEERILSIRPQVERALNAVSKITRATPGMLEVLPLGASKGDGVSRLLKSLQIAPETVLAVGDGENDVEMFGICGMSVAMANSVESATAAAKYLTSSNDDAGVAAAIEHFVFRTANGTVKLRQEVGLF
jgi:Cof subfamily protein (haloacid dehalogenase superfamily)